MEPIRAVRRSMRNSELKVLTAFYHPMDDRTAMWVRVLAGAMIAMGLLGTIVTLWALSIH
jgi:CxxC motif-containing protein (DUF1111 family)